MRLLASFLRFFFRHLYTTLAPLYDLVAYIVSVGQWGEWVRTALEPMPAAPTLELGHGPGHLMLEFLRRGHQAIGLDRSAQMMRLARRRLAARSLPVPLIRADCRALPFPADWFGSAVSTFPPEFIREPRFLAELRRVLRPGAGMLLVVQAQITGNGPLDRLAAWLFRVTGEYAELPADWLAAFERQGFQTQSRDVLLPRARVVRIWLQKSGAEGMA